MTDTSVASDRSTDESEPAADSAQPSAASDDGKRPPSWWLGHVAPWVVVAVAALYGVALRAWLLAHLPLFGDEAVVGLMGRGILHGDHTTFYWGQQYGGVEPYVVAATLRVINNGPFGLNLTAALLALAASCLVYVVLRQAGLGHRLAALGGAITWIWPYAAVWNSVRELGFRGVVLVCGLAAMAASVRIWRGRAGPVTRVVLGLALGVGWWASPEMVYFAPFVAVVLLGSWARLQRGGHYLGPPFDLRNPLLVVASAVLGSLPWLISNVRTEFGSLRTTQVPSAGYSYAERLSIFFHQVLPTQLGLRSVPGGQWVGGTVVGHVLLALFAVVIVLALVRAGRAVWRGRAGVPMVAIGMAVLFFPFLYAEFPSSWYSVDGRYGIYLPPLILILLAMALVGRKPARVPRHAAINRTALTGAIVAGLCGVLACGTLTVAAASAGGVPSGPRSFVSGWSDPNLAVRQVAAALAAHHITRAYGDYWTAYNLDLLGSDHLIVSPSPLDKDSRSTAMAHAVAVSPHPAWLFFSPSHQLAATVAFSNPETGPAGYTEKQFVGYLKGTGVPYRIVHLGVMDAVIPAHRVHLPDPEG